MATRTPIGVEATDGAARAGTLTTRRGPVATPCFMPVGTRGAVKHLSARDLDELGVGIVLANTYHLMLRPGAEVIESLGGLHGFTGWRGRFLTDSGGFQVYSLRPTIDDDGATFRSSYDGNTVRLTPERAVAIQEQLGGDIQMVLDVCPPHPAPRHEVELAVARTSMWAERAAATRSRDDQALFGIVQGGIDSELRRRSADHAVSLDFDGYGIGGLSVGETRAEMATALAATVPLLPPDRPRYLMGVGDPAGLVTAIGLGVDMFDCVLPTRHGRHGTVLTAGGRLNLRNSSHRDQDSPLDPSCPCEVCRDHSRAYLAHLVRVKEPTAARLVTLHNVAWTLRLVADARQAVVEGRFAEFSTSVLAAWG